MTKAAKGRLAEVTGKDVAIEPEQHYDDWAESYDNDLLQEYGYRAHRIAVNAFSKAGIDKAAHIMDVGCGTGLVGKELAARGYTEMDGVDISSQMLAEAGQLGLYRTLTHIDVEGSAHRPEPVYDAVLSVGTFGIGHMGPESMRTVSAYAKPGGLVVLFMNAEPFVDMDFQSWIDRLVADGDWQLLSVEDHNYMDALTRPGKLIVARSLRT